MLGVPSLLTNTSPMIKWDLFAETTDLDLEIVLFSIATNSDPWPKIFDQPGLKSPLPRLGSHVPGKEFVRCVNLSQLDYLQAQDNVTTVVFW